MSLWEDERWCKSKVYGMLIRINPNWFRVFVEGTIFFVQSHPSFPTASATSWRWTCRWRPCEMVRWPPMTYRWRIPSWLGPPVVPVSDHLETGPAVTSLDGPWWFSIYMLTWLGYIDGIHGAPYIAAPLGSYGICQCGSTGTRGGFQIYDIYLCQTLAGELWFESIWGIYELPPPCRILQIYTKRSNELVRCF